MSDALWSRLGAEPTDDRDVIDSAYHCAVSIHGPSTDLHYIWKLLRDPFYRDMASQYSEKAAFTEAGFFDDGLDVDLQAPCYTDPNWLTTPYHKILRRLSQLEEYDPAQLVAYPPVVLLTTGGFAPIHNGHIDMMELAKNEMVQKGHVVLGGYLSPSHDSYVSTKHSGSAALAEGHRMRLCHEAVAMSEWLMVDPWEARYVPLAVNYTDVIQRLERYLNHHLNLSVPLQVAYVFGGDNAAFARAFLHRGYAVCIERPGYETNVEAVKAEITPHSSRIQFAKPRLEYFNISSSSIRSREMVAMPERSSRYYASLRETETSDSDDLPKRRYLIRDESEWALEPWLKGNDRERALVSAIDLRETLKTALANANRTAPAPDKRVALQIEIPSLGKQAKYADDLMLEIDTITLDACTSGSHRLEVSRMFGLADGQCFSTQISPRPGFPAIHEQIKSIPAGQYALVDDDIASGQTMRMMMAVFPKDIQISRILSLLEQTRTVDALRVDQIDYQDFYDVVDYRDFLFGARSGGLVVRLPNRETARVPYMAPYVSLNTRIRLPASQEVPFALEMWRANERFHAALDRQILASECDVAAQRLIAYLGFGPETPVLEIVKWHAAMLEQSTRRY